MDLDTIGSNFHMVYVGLYVGGVVVTTAITAWDKCRDAFMFVMDLMGLVYETEEMPDPQPPSIEVPNGDYEVFV